MLMFMLMQTLMPDIQADEDAGQLGFIKLHKVELLVNSRVGNYELR